MFEPTQIRSDLRKSAELMQQAEALREAAVREFQTKMQAVYALMTEAANIQTVCVTSSLQRVDFLDVENRSLNEKLGSAERERDSLRIEASQHRQISAG